MYSGPFSNKVMLRSAPHPEGPWGPEVQAFTGLTPSERFDYAGKEHPELSSADGRVVVISYVRPTGVLALEMRLVQVTFQ